VLSEFLTVTQVGLTAVSISTEVMAILSLSKLLPPLSIVNSIT